IIDGCPKKCSRGVPRRRTPGGIMELVPGNRLITDTPEEGRKLAVTLARTTIGFMQPDANLPPVLRPPYAGEAASLTAAGQVCAPECRAIAAANGYWRA